MPEQEFVHPNALSFCTIYTPKMQDFTLGTSCPGILFLQEETLISSFISSFFPIIHAKSDVRMPHRTPSAPTTAAERSKSIADFKTQTA